MTRWVSLALVSLLSLCPWVASCSCSSSGTWEDDPDNWGRAFRSVKPDDVEVLHSFYWRSPHFTCEFTYYFDIRENRTLRRQLFEENELVPVTGEAALQVHRAYEETRPIWFTPKRAESYEIWTYGPDRPGNFRLLIDRETAEMFLADSQL